MPLPHVQTLLVLPSEPATCRALLKACQHLPLVQRLVSMARQLAGIDLESQLLNSDVAASTSTPAAHAIACLVAGLAAVEQFSLEAGVAAVQAASGCVGRGCGEYAALVFAGCLDLQAAVVLAQVGAGDRAVGTQTARLCGFAADETT